MSVIRKLPYIEELLASMSDANLKSLHTILNTGGNNVSLSFATLTTSYKNKVTPVYFQLDDNNVKTGILIYTNTMCALICYHKYQDLLLIKLNVTNHTYEKVNEYCDINELRRILDDTFESKGQIESGDAAEGTVPIADGSGGTIWGKASSTFEGDDIESGNAIALLGIDSNGDLVKDTIPEGIVVDETLDGASTNAVSNQAVVGGLDDVKDMIAEEYDSTATYNTSDYVIYNDTLYKCKAASVTGTWDATKWDAVNVGDELNNKANKDGNYPTMSVGEADVAKNIKAYSSDSGALQENPFISQGTGTDNNTEIVTTGTSCEIKSKNGNTVVVNQYAKELNNTYWGFVNASGNISDKVSTFTATTQFGMCAIKSDYRSVRLVANHKYLISANIKTTTTTTSIRFTLFWNNLVGESFATTKETTNWQNVSKVIEFGSTSYINGFIGIVDARASDWDAIQVKDVILIDLTQWYNGNDNIPADLLAHPDHFSWYYNDSLAYNTGSLVNANGRYLECGQGRQLWDEVTELGYIDATGNKVSSTNLRSKNYISVLPNKNCYIRCSVSGSIFNILLYDKDKNFIQTKYPSSNSVMSLTSETRYIRFYLEATYGTTYNHDITISLYYTPEQGGEGYDQYYPYVAPKVIDTGSEVLLAFDKKTPDGTWYHNTSEDTDLSTFEWTYDTSYYSVNGIHRWYTSVSDIAKLPASNSDVAEIKCDTYVPRSISDMHQNNQLGIGIAQSNGNMYVYNGSNTNSPTGHIQYALKNPTTSQGTPFSAYPDINDYSYMLWKDTDNALVEIPQGASIFYPVNYAGTLDDLVAYVDGDVTNLAKKSDLASEDAKVDSLYAIMKENVGGALRHQLVVNTSGLAFDNTAWIDLGELNWDYDVDSGRFYAVVTGIKVATVRTLPLISSIYKTISDGSSYDYSWNMVIYNAGSGTEQIYVHNKSYNNATVFKTAMKGILLAYEKASE